jgi:hypothetical protein
VRLVASRTSLISAAVALDASAVAHAWSIASSIRWATSDGLLRWGFGPVRLPIGRWSEDPLERAARVPGRDQRVGTDGGVMGERSQAIGRAEPWRCVRAGRRHGLP